MKTFEKNNRNKTYRTLLNQQQPSKQFKRNDFVYVILPMLQTIRSLVIEMERTARLNQETFAGKPTWN
jgi:hypothetical protein